MNKSQKLTSTQRRSLGRGRRRKEEKKEDLPPRKRLVVHDRSLRQIRIFSQEHTELK
jgi:hypothetical protein